MPESIPPSKAVICEENTPLLSFNLNAFNLNAFEATQFGSLSLWGGGQTTLVEGNTLCQEQGQAAEGLRSRAGQESPAAASLGQQGLHPLGRWGLTRQRPSGQEGDRLGDRDTKPPLLLHLRFGF